MRESHAIYWLDMNIYSLLKETKLHVSVRPLGPGGQPAWRAIVSTSPPEVHVRGFPGVRSVRPAEGPAQLPVLLPSALNESAPEVRAIVAVEW